MQELSNVNFNSVINAFNEVSIDVVINLFSEHIAASGLKRLYPPKDTGNGYKMIYDGIAYNEQMHVLKSFKPNHSFIHGDAINPVQLYCEIKGISADRFVQTLIDDSTYSSVIEWSTCLQGGYTGRRELTREQLNEGAHSYQARRILSRRGYTDAQIEAIANNRRIGYHGGAEQNIDLTICGVTKTVRAQENAFVFFDDSRQGAGIKQIRFNADGKRMRETDLPKTEDGKTKRGVFIETQKKFYKGTELDGLQIDGIVRFEPRPLEPEEPIYLTEGEFDALRLTLEYGVYSRVFKPEGAQHTETLRRLQTAGHAIIAAYDNDAAGRKYTATLAAELEGVQTLDYTALHMAEGTDPDDLRRAEQPELLTAIISNKREDADETARKAIETAEDFFRDKAPAYPLNDDDDDDTAAQKLMGIIEKRYIFGADDDDIYIIDKQGAQGNSEVISGARAKAYLNRKIAVRRGRKDFYYTCRDILTLSNTRLLPLKTEFVPGYARCRVRTGTATNEYGDEITANILNTAPNFTPADADGLTHNQKKYCQRIAKELYAWIARRTKTEAAAKGLINFLSAQYTEPTKRFGRALMLMDENIAGTGKNLACNLVKWMTSPRLVNDSEKGNPLDDNFTGNSLEYGTLVLDEYAAHSGAEQNHFKTLVTAEHYTKHVKNKTAEPDTPLKCNVIVTTNGFAGLTTDRAFLRRLIVCNFSKSLEPVIETAYMRAFILPFLGLNNDFKLLSADADLDAKLKSGVTYYLRKIAEAIRERHSRVYFSMENELTETPEINAATAEPIYDLSSDEKKRNSYKRVLTTILNYLSVHEKAQNSGHYTAEFDELMDVIAKDNALGIGAIDARTLGRLLNKNAQGQRTSCLSKEQKLNAYSGLPVTNEHGKAVYVYRLSDEYLNGDEDSTATANYDFYQSAICDFLDNDIFPEVPVSRINEESEKATAATDLLSLYSVPDSETGKQRAAYLLRLSGIEAEEQPEEQLTEQPEEQLTEQPEEQLTEQPEEQLTEQPQQEQPEAETEADIYKGMDWILSEDLNGEPETDEADIIPF